MGSLAGIVGPGTCRFAHSISSKLLFFQIYSHLKMAFKSLATVLFTLAAVFAEVKETESGLKVEYISKPDTCDKVARNGDMLSMHYVGTLESGAKFDSSYDRSEPFKFQIGVGQVIKGWEEGVLGMCVGEKRKLIVPPALGYGDQGAGDIIPGGATLYFEVELIDTDADNALSRDEISSYLKQQVETMQNAGGEQGEEARKMMEDQDKLVEEIFAHEDKDKDGLISHEEFSGPKHDEL